MSEVGRASVGEWLKKRRVWRIPVYQRHYAWDAADEAGPVHLFWKTVQKQTLSRLNGKKPSPHYLGAVLIDEVRDRRGVADDCLVFDVVDGQQRLTTLQLALSALIDSVGDTEYKKELRGELDAYVFIDGVKEPKLNPTQFDRKQFTQVVFAVYENLMDGNFNANIQAFNQSKIMATFMFFKTKIMGFVEEHGGEHDKKKIFECLKNTFLKGFDLAVIALRETDEAQLIFESLNNTAKPLTTFDLIRNSVFYRARRDGPDADRKLFEGKKWQEFEQSYWEESAGQRQGKQTHIEAYIARMLVAKLKKEVKFNPHDIVKVYKEEFVKKEGGKRFNSVEEEVDSISDYVEIYKCLAAKTDEANSFAVDFGVFRWSVWQNKDFYPLLFIIAGSNAAEELKQRMLNLLECYVIRREVCGYTSQQYNQFVVRLCGALGNAPNYENLLKALEEKTGESVSFPDDKAVIKGCLNVNFYSKKGKFSKYILGEVAKGENSSRDETLVRTDLTIDHILPQGFEKNQEWKKSLGLSVLEREEYGERVSQIEGRLNTIGNLTLMTGQRNSEKSNYSFAKAKELLRDSPLRMNRELAEKEKWDEKEIEKRSRELADIICRRWPRA